MQGGAIQIHFKPTLQDVRSLLKCVQGHVQPTRRHFPGGRVLVPPPPPLPGAAAPHAFGKGAGVWRDCSSFGEMSGSKVKQRLGNCMHISDIGNTWKQLLIRRESHPALSISEAR